MLAMTGRCYPKLRAACASQGDRCSVPGLELLITWRASRCVVMTAAWLTTTNQRRRRNARASARRTSGEAKSGARSGEGPHRVGCVRQRERGLCIFRNPEHRFGRPDGLGMEGVRVASDSIAPHHVLRRCWRPGLTSSTIHPARWSTDGVADPGNRESQLRTDSADTQAVKPHNCLQKGFVASGRGGLRLALVPGPTVGLTLSTTNVFDTGGGDVPMVTMKTTHRLSLDASGPLNIVTTTWNGSAPGTTSTAYKKGA